MARILKQEGLSGTAFTDITCELMLRLGRAAAQALGKNCPHSPVIYISRDTRRAADALEAALCAGICEGGGIAHCLGILPSAGMSLLLSAEDGEAGISLSGRDKECDHICIRFFGRSGLLMSTDQLDAISGLLSAGTARAGAALSECGMIARQPDAASRYLRLLGMRLSVPLDLRGMPKVRIALDCANGAVSVVAEQLFRQLGAEVLMLHNTPDGLNINRGCGVKATDSLVTFVKDYGCAAGFAFDGDGGRCLAVDESGELLDGDRLLAVLCEDRLDQQQNAPLLLPRDMQRGVAATLLSNLGFLRYAHSRGVPVHTTQPAPQFVLAKMRDLGLPMGGDGSGYLYFADSPAPDGLMTAARVLQALQRTGRPLSQLAAVMEHDPQVALSVRIPPYWREIWKNDPDIARFIYACEQELGMDGRILVREHRDDAAVRVMAEGRDFRRINNYAFAIAEVIQSRTKPRPKTPPEEPGGDT